VIIAFPRVNTLNKMDSGKQHNFMKFYLDHSKRKKVKYAPDSNLSQAFLEKTSTSKLFSIDSLELDDQEAKKNIHLLNTTSLIVGSFKNLSF
jgi:hypothetical protein